MISGQSVLETLAKTVCLSRRGRTPGFTKIRQAGSPFLFSLFSKTDRLPMVTAPVQYSGAGGRDPLFLADQYIPVIEEYVVPFEGSRAGFVP